MVQLVEEYPEFQQIAVARPVVDDAHRAAVDLGIPERADDPTFWREVHQARQAGARGVGVAYAIAEQDAKDQITGRNAGARGSGVLPFGGG